jgi:hypothetical protein
VTSGKTMLHHRSLALGLVETGEVGEELIMKLLLSVVVVKGILPLPLKQ